MVKESKVAPIPPPKRWADDSRHEDYESAKARCLVLSKEIPGCITKVRRRPAGHFDVKLWFEGEKKKRQKKKRKGKKGRNNKGE